MTYEQKRKEFYETLRNSAAADAANNVSFLLSGNRITVSPQQVSHGRSTHELLNDATTEIVDFIMPWIK